MAQSFTPGLQIKNSCLVCKIRELPVRGTILKKVGDLVRADEVVAQADLLGDLHIVRMSEQLGIEPFEVIKGLKVKPEQSVKKDELLCEHSGFFGLFKSRCLSPIEGTVELISEKTGHLGIRTSSRPITVDAYIDGRVAAVEEGKSLTIESTAALVQGIFGVGGERRGVLEILPVSPTTQLTPNLLSAQHKGKILVGGTMPSVKALHRAAEVGVQGVVVGSIDDRALAAFLGFDIGIALTGDEDIPFTLIVTEGFGNLSMSERALNLLSKYAGKGCSINGATQVRAGALRPEIIIPHPQNLADSGAEHFSQSLNLGSRIRIIRVPFFGMNATVSELPEKLTELETGAFARVLRAKLDSGEVVTVPRANVELV